MAERERRYTWEETSGGAAIAAEMSGLEFLQAHRDGRIAACGMQRTLDYRLVAVEDGLAVFRGRARDYMLNPLGTVHGGLAASMLDSAMGCAVHSTLPKGRGYTTLEFKLNLVRSLPPEGAELRAEGRIVHRGRRVATAEGRILDDDDKLYAHGTTACLIFEFDG